MYVGNGVYKLSFFKKRHEAHQMSDWRRILQIDGILQMYFMHS